MPGIFRSNHPFNVFLIFFTGIILRIHLFTNPVKPALLKADGFLYVWLVNDLQSVFGPQSILFTILGYLFVFIQAILLNTFVNKHKMFGKPNYLTAFAYIVLTALRPEWWAFSSALVLNTAIIPIWNNMVALYKNQHAKSNLFSTGLIIGICSFFYFPAALFFLLLLVSVLIMRPFRMPEWITGILGFITPYYFLASISYLLDKWNPTQFLPMPSWGLVPMVRDKWTFMLIVCIATGLILGAYHLLNQMNRLAINSRKAWNLLFYYLVVASVLPFLSSSVDLTYFFLALPPVAAGTANLFFYPQNRVIPNLLALGMITYALLLNFK